MNIFDIIAGELNVRASQIETCVGLLDEGATVPFISRYRKEVTGGLDDSQVRTVSERLAYLRGVEKRSEEITASITAQGKMTEEIAAAIAAARTLVELEDIYRPYKPKRKTRGSAARERGLEPLAELILAQTKGEDPVKAAEQFVDPEKEVPDTEAAIQGAMDIIAEDLSDNAEYRKKMRELYRRKGSVTVGKASEDADEKYRNYFELSQPVMKMSGHQILAVNRGEKEGALTVSVEVPEGVAENLSVSFLMKNSSPEGKLVEAACEDGYKRLVKPSVEREIRSELTAQANEGAIEVFKQNLKAILLAAPLKGSVTLGLDPGYAHGCKCAVVDATGKVLDTAIIYVAGPKRINEAKRIVSGLITRYKVTAIAIGNGTATRETESFTAELLGELGAECAYAVVSEAGASVYSASKIAEEEFPDFEANLRSAVSIARRLQDPLAELVKIDPKAIGVGQYQHDMPPARLDEALGGVVEDCVNSVGVDLNTASYPLLSRISGINTSIARNIVAYREENGAFTDRAQLKKVSRLGAKAYEQCAGFLRVPGARNPLDNTAVHPESYAQAEGLLKLLGLSLGDVGSRHDFADLTKGKVKDLAARLSIGVPTLTDIISELDKPGRDPRDELPPPLMRSGDVLELSDLTVGMELMGTVRNVTDFGAFVDIGVHEDGLVHISQLADRFVRKPSDVVKVGDVVKVRVLDVDLKRKRISLTMRRS